MSFLQTGEVGARRGSGAGEVGTSLVGIQEMEEEDGIQTCSDASASAHPSQPGDPPPPLKKKRSLSSSFRKRFRLQPRKEVDEVGPEVWAVQPDPFNSR